MNGTRDSPDELLQDLSSKALRTLGDYLELRIQQERLAVVNVVGVRLDDRGRPYELPSALAHHAKGGLEKLATLALVFRDELERREKEKQNGQ